MAYGEILAFHGEMCRKSLKCRRAIWWWPDLSYFRNKIPIQYSLIEFIGKWVLFTTTKKDFIAQFIHADGFSCPSDSLVLVVVLVGGPWVQISAQILSFMTYMQSKKAVKFVRKQIFLWDFTPCWWWWSSEGWLHVLLEAGSELCLMDYVLELESDRPKRWGN